MSDLLIAFVIAAVGAAIIFMIGFYAGRLTEQKAADLAESARRTAADLAERDRRTAEATKRTEMLDRLEAGRVYLGWPPTPGKLAQERLDELIPVTRAELLEAWRNHQGCT